jgi:hypothetical protein
MSEDALAEAEAYLDQVGILYSPGAVLYSSAATLRPGPIYLLGLNPGGAEVSTLADSLANTRKGHNSYLDEQWAPAGRLQPIGKSTLQRRVQHLCAMLGLDTREVPASNLVFPRSTRMITHLDFKSALPLCLPVHEMFMKVIRPRFIMTYGSMNNFRGAVGVIASESRSAEHGSWMAHRGRAAIAEHEVAFGNIPHMSVWASDKRLEIIRWATEDF